MSNTISLIGALESNGDEFALVKAAIYNRGQQVLMINNGISG